MKEQRSPEVSLNQSRAWGGRQTVTLFAREKGIPPSVEKVLLKLNKALRGFPPFLLTDLGRMVEPPVTKGLRQLPPGQKKRVAVIGAGLSGKIAALELVKLGYQVDIYEATDFIGGRLGAKPSDTSPTGFWEHGLHHFFNNVYDYLMQKIIEVGADKHFEPVDEVLLEFENYEQEVLEAKPNAHLLNMLGIVWRSPNVTMLDAIKSAPGMLSLFFYNHERVIEKYDHLTMVEYSKNRIAKPFFDTFIKTVLTVSLNRTEDISAAQALHLMWTFFIRKPDAMLRVVPTDNHYTSIMLPFKEHLSKLGVKIHLNHRVNNLKLEGDRVTGLDFTDGTSVDLDYLVMATDIRGTKEIFAATQIESSESNKNLEQVRAIVNKLRVAPPYVVARAYLSGKPENPDRPDVIETPENQPVDLVFQAHKTEKSDKTWVKAAPVGEDRWVIEVHAYDLGPTLARKYSELKAKVSHCSDEELWQLILQLSDQELWDAIKEELRDIDGLSRL
ncbi:MAG: oleate hydratase, partial [Cyanobacteria bacterium P01_G01_bin.19]